MGSHKPPAEPLLVILGSTGTGKSELAVELATRFRGEIINADAMQLYNGLPIITNKIPLDERRGIPHHLLGHISVAHQAWQVDEYKREATKVMAGIRERGNLPILVGGSNYYVNSLLFTDVILDDIDFDTVKPLPILAEPNEVLLRELQKCDPVMAERWHPNDRRKIQRSLEIYLQTGRRASELYAEQRKRKAETTDASPWEKLLFWVWSDREVLCDRLDRRVDKMVEAGLLDEVRQLYEVKCNMTAQNGVPDMTKGIWQSIGYKQLEPYIEALDRGDETAQLERLKADGIADVKAATRRYANTQTRWMRLKMMRLLQEQGPEAVENLYVLDSTDVSQFQHNVVAPAADLTRHFLRGDSRPAAMELSERARDVLSSAGGPPLQATPCRRTCDMCQTVHLTEQAWNRHVKGVSHRRLAKRKQRRALVPYEPPSGNSDGESRCSSPDIASLF